MKLKSTIQTICLVASLCGLSASAKIAQPNEFFFTSDVYYVENNATNAIIEVGFIPGNRGYSGSVEYKASNGSSTSGQGFIGVTNTLSFSGLAPSKTFTISIPVNSLRQGNETVRLSLSNPDAIITRGSATLVIVFKPAQPKVELVKADAPAAGAWPMTTNGNVKSPAALADGLWASVPLPDVSGGLLSFTATSTGSAYLSQNYSR
ncbi:MAG: hypothetical protein JWM68_3029 [Verrucomicrobiales bacterium]|nr:hypothetical protein [Verrucomicrobiales bacterium]